MTAGIGLTEQKPLKPLLRPRQAADLTEEVRRIDNMLKLPASQLVGVDIPAAIRQRNNMQAQLDELSPGAIPSSERDEARRAELELREQISQGMPTAQEMRRNPPGAVDKHRAWEKRSKRKILEWKNLRLRMHQTGMLGAVPADATDIANVETFRPVHSSHELSMDGAQIPAERETYLPPRIASQNHADDATRERWEDETNRLLADQAVSGSDRAKALLQNRTGGARAKTLLKEAHERRKDQGTPPEHSPVLPSKPMP